MVDLKKTGMGENTKGSIQCKYYGEIIGSKTVYDFVLFFCGKSSVDEGKEYLYLWVEEYSRVNRSIIENE
jgi:hypothetical protein